MLTDPYRFKTMMLHFPLPPPLSLGSPGWFPASYVEAVDDPPVLTGQR